jgi:hypothetical protein
MRSDTDKPMPWWRYGHVWLIISGPLLVVIAGFATLAIALVFPDPVLSDRGDQQGREKPKQNTVIDLTPAMQARNHAVTGAIPPEAAQQP